jgi:hypothetical protein
VSVGQFVLRASISSGLSGQQGLAVKAKGNWVRVLLDSERYGSTQTPPSLLLVIIEEAAQTT